MDEVEDGVQKLVLTGNLQLVRPNNLLASCLTQLYLFVPHGSDMT
jgi:hypothetical protein